MADTHTTTPDADKRLASWERPTVFRLDAADAEMGAQPTADANGAQMMVS